MYVGQACWVGFVGEVYNCQTPSRLPQEEPGGGTHHVDTMGDQP